MRRSGVVIAATWSDSPVSLMARALARELGRHHGPVRFLAARHGQVEAGTDGIDEIRAWPGPFRSPRSVWFAWRALDGRPQAIIANFGAVNLLMMFGWVRRVPVRIAWYNTLAAALDLDTGPLPWWRRYQRPRKMLIYRLATTVVAAGEAGAEDLRTIFGVPEHKIVIEPNLVADLADPSMPAQPAGGVPTFVCVARLFPVKDHATIFRALARTREPCRLVLLGEGPLLVELEGQVAALGLEDRVTFCGVVTYAEVHQQLRTAWAMVLASTVENFGLAVVEAMALGVPVITSRVCGLPSIVGEGTGAAGRLFEAGDEVELARQMDDLAADGALQADLGLAARARYLETFSLERGIGGLADRMAALISVRGVG